FVDGILFAGKVKGWPEVDSVDWPVTDLLGRRAHGVLKNLRIYDPRGVLIVNVPRATATIDWWTVVFPPHDVVIDDLVLEGGCALISEYPAWSRGPRAIVNNENGCPSVEEDYIPGVPAPMAVGFIDAFAPTLARSALGVGGPSVAGPIVQIRRLTLAGVDVEMAFQSFHTKVKHVSGDGMLQVSVREPRRPELMFQLAPRAPEATLDLPSLALHFDVTDIDGQRFAIYPSEKDALQFDA